MCAITSVQVGSGATLLAVGFKDGVLRLVRRCSDGLRLVSACKPHKGRVTAVAPSPDGRWLCTAGEDGNLFFFSSSSSAASSDGASSDGAHLLHPAAFTKIPATVTCAVWAADGKAVLCGTAAGTVIEVVVPELGAIDTGKTYEVSGLMGR